MEFVDLTLIVKMTLVENTILHPSNCLFFVNGSSAGSMACNLALVFDISPSPF